MTDSFNGIPELPPESWLFRAFEYAKTRSQLPDNVIFWTLCAFCGAALQDSIRVDWAVKPIFPNLPLLIVGESGLGKTGAKNAIEPLFERCLPYKSAEDSTAEAMTRDLSHYGRTKYNNTSGLWIVPELADVLGNKDYQQGAVARLTRLFDNPFNREVSRATSGKITLNGYCVLSWIAGTTYEWLEKHVDEAVSAGGFLPRLAVIYTREPAKFVPNPKRDQAIVSKLNAELIQMLNAVNQQKVIELASEWDCTYRGIFTTRNEVRGTRRAPFVARRAENTLRIHIILNEFGQIRVNSGEFGLAEKCAKWFEEQAVTLDFDLKFGNSGAPSTRLKAYLSRNRTVSYAALMKNLGLKSRELREALQDLIHEDLVAWNGQFGNKGECRWLGGSNDDQE